jgi:hypothetical protein
MVGEQRVGLCARHRFFSDSGRSPTLVPLHLLLSFTVHVYVQLVRIRMFQSRTVCTGSH